MKEEPIWKIGRAWVNIQTALNDSLELVEKNPDIYLTRNFLADINVHKQDWDLEEDDEFFACMNEDGFSKLQPSDPSQPIVPYDAVEPPDSDPPTNVWELESCAVKIAGWFDELRYRKLSEDGHGMAWPKTAGLWYPRQRTKFEYDSYSGNRMTVPWELSDAHATEGDPHHVYYAWFGDDCLEGVVLRSELQMLLGCTIAEMQRASLCQYNIPVRLSFTLTSNATSTNIHNFPGTLAFSPRR